MHTYYGYYYVRHSDFPRKNWTVPNVETAYALCHRLSKDLNAHAPDLLIIIDALFKELMQFPRDAEHLVNFVKVLLLETNHFPGVFLKKN